MRTTQLTALNRTVEGVHHPIGDISPGAAWLKATAARADEVQRLLAEGHHRDTLLRLHAHYVTEDRRFDPCKVAADLHVRLCHRARDTGQRFAAEVALFRLARTLLDKLTTPEPIGARPVGQAGADPGWPRSRPMAAAGLLPVLVVLGRAGVAVCRAC